jgi:diadenosine tetraphosphate (Ap4A) HIT family hydrolase
MRMVAEAIAAAVRPWKMNYECLGNQEAHVHWHLFPRYESDELRRAPVWVRPESERKKALSEPDRVALVASLGAQIRVRLPDARTAGN